MDCFAIYLMVSVSKHAFYAMHFHLCSLEHKMFCMYTFFFLFLRSIILVIKHSTVYLNKNPGPQMRF